MSILFKLILLSYILQQCGSLNTACDLHESKYGFVCKCTVDYCDYLEEPKLETENNWIATSSSKNGLRFNVTGGEFGSSQTYKIDDYNRSLKFNSDAVVLDAKKSSSGVLESIKDYFKTPQAMDKLSININRSKTFQTIAGFGGALTGSVAHLLEKLKPSLQNQLYKSYFHKNGIAYNILRTSIGGSDFDLEAWAYNEIPRDDKYLTNFTKLDPRDLLKVKQLKKIKEIAKLNQIKILAAAWSPPPWMKSNNNWSGFGVLKKEYYGTWAKYHIKYLELMSAQNIPIWAISTGNEPLNGIIGWFIINFMSLGWTPSEQAIYLNDFLGPELKKSNFKNVLIFSNDDQRFSYPTWFQKMNSSRPTSLNYIDGLAVHWYWDNVFEPTLIDATMELMPNKLLLSTEACIGDKPWEINGPKLGSWKRGERYILSILQDLQHNFNGWIDWNLLLDERGGPNYVNNTVDAPIVVNTTTYAEFYKQPLFYAIGHFSKFISENSTRVEVKLSSTEFEVDTIAFKRPDNRIVLIIFNGAAIPQDVKLNDSVRGVFTVNVPAESVHTIVYM